MPQTRLVVPLGGTVNLVIARLTGYGLEGALRGTRRLQHERVILHQGLEARAEGRVGYGFKRGREGELTWYRAEACTYPRKKWPKQ